MIEDSFDLENQSHQQQKTNSKHNISQENSNLQEEIPQFQNFIQEKYSQVKNLQNYLVQQLQYIEKCKDRNQHIERTMITVTIPTLKELKKQIQRIADLVNPLKTLSENYLKIVSEKSLSLLLEKQKQIKDLKKQNLLLKNQIQQIKIQSSKKDIEKIKPSNQAQKSKDNFYYEKYDHFNLPPTPQKKVSIQNNGLSLTPPKLIQPKKISKSPSNFKQNISQPKSSSKMTKYEEEYNNIVNRKPLINYRCERPPLTTIINSTLSPSKSTHKIEHNLSRVQSKGIICNRKDYIKQKIQKIKVKCQYKAQNYN